MILLLVFSKDDITDKNSSINIVILSLYVLGGLYTFPMVIVFDKLFPVTLIISPSQCSLSTYISNPPLCYTFPLVLYNHIHLNKIEINHYYHLSTSLVSILC